MIRPAKEYDLPAIGRIYEEILAEEEGRPISYTNWQRGKYPTVEHARRALESGGLWAAEEEDGRLSGAFILNGEQLPEYDDIPWQFQAERDQVAVIHTLVVSPSWAGRGRAQEMVRFCEAEASRQGRTVVRLDTPTTNVPANGLYQKLGYRLSGSTEFFFQGFIHELLNCYEKRL